MEPKSTSFFKIAGAGVFLIFILGIIWPEFFWGASFVGYFSPMGKVVILGIGVALFLSGYWFKKQDLKFDKGTGKLFMYTFPFFYALLLYMFPISTDMYGDALFLVDDVDITISKWDYRLLKEPLELGFFDTKVGLRTFFEINNLLTYLTGWNGTEVVPVVEAVLGFLFCWLWIKLVRSSFESNIWRLAFFLLGVLSPLIAVFTAHYESYAYDYVLILIWWMCLKSYFKNGKTKWLWRLPVIFVIVLQGHITNWLLLPSLFSVYAWHFRERIPQLKNLFTWGGAFKVVGIPVIVVTAIAYFFIFENHDGPRRVKDEALSDTLFLPLYTDEPAPYDRYNLQSFYHFVDYFNTSLMWSAAAVLLLIGAVWFRKRINWQNPINLILAFTFLIYWFIFFVFNPLLGLSIDWDLFAIPGISALVLCVVLYSDLEQEIEVKSIAGPVSALAFIGSLFMVVNSNPGLLAKHFRVIGDHSFKTYWIGASTSIIHGVNNLDSDEEKLFEYDSVLEELLPYAVMGNDKEYGQILVEKGILQKKNGDVQGALKTFELAHEYHPKLMSALFELVKVYHEIGEVQKAWESIDWLVKYNYKPYKKTLLTAIQLGLNAGQYQRVADYAVTYLAKWPKDKVVGEIEYRLRNGIEIERLKELFR